MTSTLTDGKRQGRRSQPAVHPSPMDRPIARTTYAALAPPAAARRPRVMTVARALRPRPKKSWVAPLEVGPGGMQALGEDDDSTRRSLPRALAIGKARLFDEVETPERGQVGDLVRGD